MNGNGYGNRKMIVHLTGMVAVTVLAALGKIDAATAWKAVLGIATSFGAFNSIEHITDQPKAKNGVGSE
jgi:hypothetical protein